MHLKWNSRIIFDKQNWMNQSEQRSSTEWHISIEIICIASSIGFEQPQIPRLNHWLICKFEKQKFKTIQIMTPVAVIKAK